MSYIQLTLYTRTNKCIYIYTHFSLVYNYSHLAIRFFLFTINLSTNSEEVVGIYQYIGSICIGYFPRKQSKQKRNKKGIKFKKEL